MNEDVNSQLDSVESTESQEQVNVDDQVTEPAEALNTEGNENRLPEHVPYSRFKEINDKYREYSEKLKSFEERENLYKIVEQFNDTLEKDPELQKSVQEALRQSQARMQSTNTAANPQQGQQQNQLSDYQRVTLDRYNMDLQSKLKAEGIPEKHHERVVNLIYSEAGKLNGNALNQYDPSLVDKAYANISDFFNGIKQQATSEYVNQKKGDVTPASATKSGAAPIKSHKFSGRGDRAAFLASGLSAAHKQN